ncbi:MAG: class I SAM-dependent methyltransferase [Gaiellaceae bacterium]
MRGWLPFFRASVGLGARHLLRRGYLREAVVRVVIPLDPSRYLELPWARRMLAPAPGQRVLDLASPKLLAVMLARDGAEVVSVDELDEELERWRKLTEREPHLRFEPGDGRSLPFPDAGFDHAVSVSVLEHIPEPGDEQALRELVRVVRPGGRIVLTLPFAEPAREDWLERPKYADHGAGDGGHFFQRWYDEPGLARLLGSSSQLELRSRELVRLSPNWQRLYARVFPWLVALGPLYGLLARERKGPGGDVVRLLLVHR